MGKEAVEVNQQGTEQIGATNWKDEQIAGQNKPQVSPFPYDQSMGESHKDFQTGSTFQPGPDVGSGLEIRPPVKEFHGDKWQDVHGGGMQNLGGQFRSEQAPVMEEPPAGGFHGDKWKESHWSALPPTHSDVHSNKMGDHWGDKSAYQDWQVKNDAIKNEAREGKQAMHAELKSHAGSQDVLIKPSDISGHHFEGMTTDGRSVMPETVNVHDGRSRVNYYDGRDATSVNDGRTEEEMPLKERVVSGVRAGDPLSFHKDHSEKPVDRSIEKDVIHSGFPRDEHLKSDKGLIPHEHLKKDHPLFPTEHISGGQPDHIFQEKHQYDADHLRKLHENPKIHGDTAVHGGHPLPGSLHNESDIHDRDLKEQGTMGGIKEKIHHGKEKLKEKLGMKKDDETRVSDTQAHPRGHEIATIKIPGIEARDRAAQEMVNQQAKAKKELNAELKGHAAHSDHITPSEILTHAVPRHEDSGSKVSTHLTMPAACVITDPLTRDQVISKSEVNAEILDHASDLGSSELIKPSEVAESSSLDYPKSSMGQSQGIQSGIHSGEGFQSDQGINQSFGNKDIPYDSSLGSSNLSGGHMGSFGNKDLTHGSSLGSSNLSGGQIGSFGNKDMTHDSSLGSSNLSGGHMGSFGNKDLTHDSSLGSSNLSGGHMGSSGNKDMNLGSNNLTGERMEPFANKDLHHEPLGTMAQNQGVIQDLPSSNIGSIGNKDIPYDSSLGSSNLSGGHMGSFGNKDLTHGSSLGSSNLSGGHMGSFGNKDVPYEHGSFNRNAPPLDSSLGYGSGGHVSSFGNKDRPYDSSLGSSNLSGGHMGGIGHKDAPPLDSSLGYGSGGHVSSFGNKDMTHGSFGNKDLSHDSLSSDKFGESGTQKDIAVTDIPHKSSAGMGTGISQPILNTTPDNRSGGLDANNDQIMKDHVKAKREVNAEIKELPRHSETIMPSEMGTTSAHTFPSDTTSAHTVPSRTTSAHTVPSTSTHVSYGSGTTGTHVPSETGATVTTDEHHLSTTDKIKEKVSQAAQAVKDTFKKH